MCGALLSVEKATPLNSIFYPQAAPMPSFQSSLYPSAHASGIDFFFYTYRVFNHLSLTSRFPAFSLEANAPSKALDQVSPFILWLPSAQAQLVVPSIFQLKGLSGILIQPQLFSQTLNTSS